MKFFYQLEKKFGKYAIRDLPRYIAGMYAIGAVILFINPSMYYVLLSLNGSAIAHGQIWRVVTFLLFPPLPSAGQGIFLELF